MTRSRKTQEPSSRFRAEDWLDLGELRLAIDGPEGLTVEALTAAGRRTRGSFYHHFQDREAFIEALLRRWRSRVVDEEARRYQANPDPKAWRTIMLEAPYRVDFALERAIRRLAASDRLARSILEEVDTERLKGLTMVLTYVRPDTPDAKSLALALYAYLVGCQWLLKDFSDPRIPALVKTARELFGLAP